VVLSTYLFQTLTEVWEITDDCIDRYNQIRTHDSLGSLLPARYRERLLAVEIPLLIWRLAAKPTLPCRVLANLFRRMTDRQAGDWGTVETK
jgi:hypothetical protein